MGDREWKCCLGVVIRGHGAGPRAVDICGAASMWGIMSGSAIRGQGSAAAVNAKTRVAVPFCGARGSWVLPGAIASKWQASRCGRKGKGEGDTP